MRTDTIFYQLLQNYPNLVFELMGLPAESGNGYQFVSVEVKEKSFRFDGIAPASPSGLWKYSSTR